VNDQPEGGRQTIGGIVSALGFGGDRGTLDEANSSARRVKNRFQERIKKPRQEGLGVPVQVTIEALQSPVAWAPFAARFFAAEGRYRTHSSSFSRVIRATGFVRW
jgi:hypothetical protein